jgi:hypothetical protein
VEFCRTLRTQADVMGCTSCVAIYQAPQDAYNVRIQRPIPFQIYANIRLDLQKGSRLV